MAQTTLTDYTMLQKSIQSHDPVSTPAELHGLLCGLICAAGTRFELPSHYQESEVMLHLLPLVTEQFSEALEQNQFSIELMLPDDEQPLAIRAQAMGEWAQGFLAGLGEGGLTRKLHNEVLEEMLQDFHQIAQIQPGDVHDETEVTEDDEKALFEVQEYMGVGVLSVYTELLILNNLDEAAETMH
ncbi:MAG: UPF0149 family protein [Gammaproteobacteria bacterium]|nr:UPF0149 family protein [Gammaproteobacteria bacterium]